MNLGALGNEIVAEAQKKGASEAEAFLEATTENYLEVRNQVLETSRLSRTQGLGLRVLVGERLGFAYTTDFSKKAGEELIAKALACAREATPDCFHVFPAPSPPYPELALFDPEIETTPLEAKVALAQEVEAAGHAFDPRVKITEACVYEDSITTVYLVSSRGINLSYQSTACGLYAFLVAVTPEEAETGFGFQFSLHYKDLDAKRVGQEAAAKAVQMLGARGVLTQKVPLIFDPYVTINFLGVIAPALSADAVQKGKSLFAGKQGEKLASPLVNLIDDGRLPTGLNSAPFDGEGVPTQETTCFREGILQAYLYNIYTATKDKVSSTGNASRSSFRSIPTVGISNFYLAPGESSPADLLKSVSRGFYVTEVMGIHTANPISGDFSVGAAGVWIENGELTIPVRGVVIAGNICELLVAVEGVANDLVFLGGMGAPTLKIGPTTVSGG